MTLFLVKQVRLSFSLVTIKLVTLIGDNWFTSYRNCQQHLIKMLGCRWPFFIERFNFSIMFGSRWWQFLYFGDRIHLGDISSPTSDHVDVPVFFNFLIKKSCTSTCATQKIRFFWRRIFWHLRKLIAEWENENQTSGFWIIQNKIRIYTDLNGHYYDTI